MGRTKTKPFLKRKKVPKLYFHFWPPKNCPSFFFLIHTWWYENIIASPCAKICQYFLAINNGQTKQWPKEKGTIIQAMVYTTLHKYLNQRLPWACNRSPGSKLLSITTQLHCGGHLGGRARLPDTILEEDHPMTIPSKFGSIWAAGSRPDGFYVNFP